MRRLPLPSLFEIDLSKCCQKKGGHGMHHHPDINSRSQYLVLIGKDFYVGRFRSQWYGWYFDGGGSWGIQLDKPGTNSSEWKGIWEIIK